MIRIIPSPRNHQVILQVQGLKDGTKRAIRNTLWLAGKKLVADTKTEINKKPKHGRVYYTGVGIGGTALKKGIRKHIASAPGEAPAVITGTLRKSINFTVHGSSEMEFGVDLSRGDAYYGRYLEYFNLITMSGRGSKNIAPRPFISAAYKMNKNYIQNMFNVMFTRETQPQSGANLMGLFNLK
jgi:hypothetical protein